MPRPDRPLLGRKRRLSLKPGAAAFAPSTCAGPLPVCEERLFILRQRRLAAQLLHLRGRKRVRSSTGACVTAADTSISPGRNSGVPDYGTCEKGASEAKVSEIVVSNIDPLLARISPHSKMTTVLRRYRVMCHRVGHTATSTPR